MLVLDLPEPLVHLVFLHTQFISECHAFLSSRHLALILAKKVPQGVHLLRMLADSGSFLVFFAPARRCCHVMTAGHGSVFATN